jgi:hypothetical protein
LTGLVAADLAVVEPAAFVAVTLTRRVEPASALTIWYAEFVAPPIAVQLPPPGPHRSHAYAYDVGDPVHVPTLALRVMPTMGVPEIVGAAVLTGAVGAAVMVAVAGELALALPALLLAVTVKRMVAPMSLLVRV